MILQNLTHPLNQKQADENVNNSKIKMNVKMYKNGNTAPPSDSREGFHKVTMPSNVLNYSPKGGCKDPSHFLFSGFVYCYLENPFSSYTVNILNVSYYLTIERDLVQVGLMSKDPSSLHF